MRQNRQLVIFVFVRVCLTWSLRSCNPPRALSANKVVRGRSALTVACNRPFFAHTSGFRAFDTAQKFRDVNIVSRICSENRRISLTKAVPSTHVIPPFSFLGSSSGVEINIVQVNALTRLWRAEGDERQRGIQILRQSVRNVRNSPKNNRTRAHESA